MKYIRFIWILICLLWVIVILLDAFYFVKYPYKYPIGTELSWNYESEANYLLSSAISTLWLVIGVVLGTKSSKEKNYVIYFVAHILITVVCKLLFSYFYWH